MKKKGVVLSQKEIDTLLDDIAYKPGRKYSEKKDKKISMRAVKELTNVLTDIVSARDKKGRKILSDKEIDTLLSAIARPVDDSKMNRSRKKYGRNA